MADYGLEDWSDIARDGRRDALLCGNGVSLAVSDRFGYTSLYEGAQLSAADRELFDAVATTNFEQVLRHLRSAALVCRHLGHDDQQVAGWYEHVRDALVTAVHRHHMAWNDVVGERLARIRDALREYRAVFTTSYDLILYWAMMAGRPDAPAEGFADMFWNADHCFDPENTELHDAKKTMVYWLHGGLHLCRTDRPWVTRKQVNTGASLLGSFASGDDLPLYVSEGSSEEKQYAIGSSDYLSHGMRALETTQGGLVVLGQALGESDRHLVNAIAGEAGRHVAYGVHGAEQDEVDSKRTMIRGLLPGASIRFFDSRTHPLCSPNLHVDS